jgi:hypothetical protein
MDTILIDRDMAHVILSAFNVASFEGMSSLNSKDHPIKGKPEGQNYADAELRVLRILTVLYPDVAYQYFDIKKQ